MVKKQSRFDFLGDFVAQSAVIKGGTQIRTGGEGFADPCLTTWLCRRTDDSERMMIITNSVAKLQ